MVLYARANNTVYCSMGLNSWSLMVHRYFGCCCSYNFFTFCSRSVHFISISFFILWVFFSSLCSSFSFALWAAISFATYLHLPQQAHQHFRHHDFSFFAGNRTVCIFTYLQLWMSERIRISLFYILKQRTTLSKPSQQYFEFRSVLLRAIEISFFALHMI